MMLLHIRKPAPVFAKLLAVFSAAFVFSFSAEAQTTFLWGPAGADINWSTPENWSPTGVPGILDTAVFGDADTTSDPATVNNIVNTSTTVSTLSYTNATSGAWHVTQISAPNKLTVTNGFLVGGQAGSDSFFTSVAMTGNGTFEVDGNNFKVSNLGSSSSTEANATFDMSGLSNFVYNAPFGTWIVGGSGGDARGGGVLNLAGYSNNITVGTINFNTGSCNNSKFVSLIQLGGGTNIFNVNNFVVCQTKAQFATVQFQPSAPAEAGLTIRGTNGATDDSSRGDITLGDRNNTGSAGTDGEMLLNGHPVNIKADTLVIGQDRSSSSGTSTHFGKGILQFDTGVVDATTINIANCTSGNTASSANGELTVGANGTLIVGTNGMTLGNLTSATSAYAGFTNSGTAFCSNSIVKGTATATANIDLSNGKLTMVSGGIGTPNAPIDSLTVASSTLTLPVDYTLTNIVVANYNPVDDASVINISALPILTGYPSTFPLVTYGTLAGAGSISIGTLPGTFKGYITNDTTARTVFLVVTNGPATSKSDLWQGNVSGTWDTSTKNWTTNGVAAAYTENDTVTFDDSAIRTNITYSTTHTPLGMSFANNSVAYNLGGTGKISGDTGLTNSGAGSVTLSASGGDDFDGGIHVNAGTVILDDANSAITGPLTIASGATFQLGNNDANGNLPSSVDDQGTLIFNRSDSLDVDVPITDSGSVVKIGNGVLTLSNANTYTGDTTVTKGTLALAGAGSIAGSANVNVGGATLDMSAVSSPTVNNLNLTNAVLVLGSSNTAVPLNAAFVSMAGTANTINITALPAFATYPATVPLVKTVSGVSGFNAQIGSFPAATPAYAGSVALSGDGTAIELTVTAGPVGTRPAVFWTGADAVSGNTNWSDAANWQTPGVPTAVDNVVFNDTAVVFDPLTIDNKVDANTTISTLSYTNSTSGQWHVTEIPAGITLTVNSNMTVGGLSGSGITSSAAVTGGGTLVVNGTSLAIGNNGSSGVDSGTILDLSGLSNFVYSVPTGTIQMGSGNRSIAAFKLANGSNYITADSLNDNTTSTSSSGTGDLTLGGGTNIINVANFNIGAGRSSSTVSFPDVTGGLRVRGVGGTDNDRAAMTIGNRNNSGGSGNTINDFFSVNGHPVDMKLSTLTLGKSGSNPSGTANGNGTFSFDTGTVDVNSIVMGVASGSTIGVQASGTLNVGAGGTLIVGTGGVSLGNKNAASGLAAGALNIGGTVVSSGDLVKATASATSSITITSGGVLKMLSGVIGTPDRPVDTLTLDTATIQLAVDGSSAVTNIVATTITAANTSTINIGSVTRITAPATVSLISYVGADPFPNLVLGTLPAGVTATLVDDQANATIDLNITSAPAPSVPPTINNITISGRNIIISGTNNIGSAGTFHLLTSTNLSLPLANWTVLTNSSFNNGNFSITNAIDPTKPAGFYILQVP